MRKRLLVGLLSAGLEAAMVPGTAMAVDVPVHCLGSADGRIASHHHFEGDVEIFLDSTATGTWFHAGPGGALVQATVDHGSCLHDGSTVLHFWGTGSWHGHAVDFDVIIRDDSPDNYDISISTPAGDILQQASGDITSGDISTDVP